MIYRHDRKEKIAIRGPCPPDIGIALHPAVGPAKLGARALREPLAHVSRVVLERYKG